MQDILLMAEILHQFIGSLSDIPLFIGFHTSQVVSRISAIYSMKEAAGLILHLDACFITSEIHDETI